MFEGKGVNKGGEQMHQGKPPKLVRNNSNKLVNFFFNYLHYCDYFATN